MSDMESLAGPLGPAARLHATLPWLQATSCCTPLHVHQGATALSMLRMLGTSAEIATWSADKQDKSGHAP